MNDWQIHRHDADTSVWDKPGFDGLERDIVADWATMAVAVGSIDQTAWFGLRTGLETHGVRCLAESGGQARTGVVCSGPLAAFRSALGAWPEHDGASAAIAAKALAEALRISFHPAAILRCGRHVLPLGRKTYVMGVLNVTPDSFSDGGRYLSPAQAVDRAQEMVSEGTDIIDVGGESTRPFSEPVSAEEELERVIPVIRALKNEVEVPISIDTYKAAVAHEALAAGAAMINDIGGLQVDESMAQVAADYDVPVVVMHMKGKPHDMQVNPEYRSVVGEIGRFLLTSIDRAVKAGVKPDQIILDPGVGFGKTTAHNLALLRHLREFRQLGYPLLLGTSRKSVIGNVLDLPIQKRQEGTAATMALAVAHGVDIVRVHDVATMRRTVDMADAVVRGWRENLT